MAQSVGRQKGTLEGPGSVLSCTSFLCYVERRGLGAAAALPAALAQLHRFRL